MALSDVCPLSLSRAEIIEYTPEWEGARFEDGRPRVPDDVLARMEGVSITQAWGTVRGAGYENAYEGGWEHTQPGKTLVGRAFTAMYMPRRPGMRAVMEQKGEGAGCVGDQISWPIDNLQPGDVYVADCFGKIATGPIIGDNLAVAIKANSGKGVVFDGSVRDLEGIEEMDDFPCFVRGWHPSYASPTIMLAGMNCPVRMGEATCMPGDVVLAKREGVVFIPAHLAEGLVTSSEQTRLRDIFGKGRLVEGVYTPGQIDRQWSEEIDADFDGWLAANAENVELGVAPAGLQALLEQRRSGDQGAADVSTLAQGAPAPAQRGPSRPRL
jgi:regulator of RNase E activity RraA